MACLLFGARRGGALVQANGFGKPVPGLTRNAATYTTRIDVRGKCPHCHGISRCLLLCQPGHTTACGWPPGACAVSMRRRPGTRLRPCLEQRAAPHCDPLFHPSHMHAHAPAGAAAHRGARSTAGSLRAGLWLGSPSSAISDCMPLASARQWQVTASSSLLTHIFAMVHARVEGQEKSWHIAPARPWGSRAPRREQRGQIVQRRLRGRAVPDAPPDQRRAGGLRQAHPRPGVGLVAGLLDDDLVAGADAARAPVRVRHGRKQLRGAGPERDLAHAVRIEQHLRACRGCGGARSRGRVASEGVHFECKLSRLLTRARFARWVYSGLQCW